VYGVLNARVALRSYQLGQQLGQLPQFQQAGVGVLGKVALGQLPQPKQLLVVCSQVREVAGW
jgi:hypothetical protein